MAAAFTPKHKFLPDENLKNKNKRVKFLINSLHYLARYVSILNRDDFKSIN
ncbi:hypothetical protein CSC35_0461 [Enterobacter hormaechei]|nr:hypothetical protein CSC35_0461 [Enterobacter hormaechei]